MAGFSQNDRENLIDLLGNHVDEAITVAIAKSFTKKAIAIEGRNDALKAILVHGIDLRNILSKRYVTKEILFKYLHHNQVQIENDLTKHLLIERTIKFWNRRNEARQNEANIQGNIPNVQMAVDNTENFPINLLARQFTQWFFKRYNSNEISVADFWMDATLVLTIYFEDMIDERNASNSHEVVEALYRVKNDFNLLYNACTVHQGCQGRIDIHGLVLVLSCGTIHTPELCVGVFESVFKLMRDPFDGNNWKLKGVNFILRSKMNAENYSLENSENMRDLLALPAAGEEI